MTPAKAGNAQALGRPASKRCLREGGEQAPIEKELENEK